MLFAIPNDRTFPQLGPFSPPEHWSENLMRWHADATFGVGCWQSSDVPDASRQRIGPESEERAAFIATRIVADREAYLAKYGAGSWKIEMVKTYRNRTGCTLVEARDAIVAALEGATPPPN